MKFDKVKRFPSLREQVCENLRRAVLEGAFSMGEQITEEKVAEYLGVSRTPVREALNTLAHEGILSPRDKRGYDLFTPTSKNMKETFVVRELIEPAAIQRVVKNATPLLPERLQEIVNKETQADRDDNIREFAIQNLEFRLTLYESCDNLYIQEILSKFDHCSFYMVLWSVRQRGDLRQFIINNQQDIIEALQRGDAQAATSAVMAYLEKGRANINELQGISWTEVQ